MSSGAKMLSLPGATLVLTCAEDLAMAAGLAAAGAEVVSLPASEGELSLTAVLDELGRRQVNEVLIEAGPTLAGAALGAGLIDELVIYMAPHIMGDAARGLFHLPGLERMADRVQLDITDIRAVGSDWRITARPL